MEKRLAFVGLMAAMLALGNGAWAQETQMPGMKMPPGQKPPHAEGEMPTVKVDFPQLGRAQNKEQGKLFTLEEALRLAGEKNPTLRQAEAGIRAAKGRQRQAGMYPNPVVGYAGDEIRGGSTGGGKQGFFVEQRIVTGGKLAKARDVFSKEAKLAEIEAEEQKTRVETAVKIAFYRTLAAQELADARADLKAIAIEGLEVQKRLENTGQADETEVLDAEIEVERLGIAERMAENTLREEWRSLTAVLGAPDLSLEVLAGNLEQGWPKLNEEEAINAIARLSPAVRIADAAKERAASNLARAKSEAIPDIRLRGGLEYNNELLGGIPRATGWEGTADVGLEIPIFDRNQGNVATAGADIARADAEKQRIALTLRERAATVFDEYASARLMATAYRDEILPRARKAYSLMTDRYAEMLAAYPRVLEAKRRLFELQVEYIRALENTWTTGVSLQGYLLTDGLEAPARPEEMDRAVRETNIPVPERNMGPRPLGMTQP